MTGFCASSAWSCNVNMVYDIADESQIEEDLALLAKGMKLLQMDYLGGHGTRGSGRVSLREFQISPFEADVDAEKLTSLFREVEAYELLSL